MNNQIHVNNLPFDDDLDAAFAGLPIDRSNEKRTSLSANTIQERVDAAYGLIATTFKENCTKCGGTGKWRGIRECFSCKGKGFKEFQTSPQDRAKARAMAANKKAKASQEHRDSFAENFPAEFEWLQANAGKGNNFASSLLAALDKYGELTENQLNAIRRSIVKQQEWNVSRETQVKNAVAVDISVIETAFQTARNNQIQHPKLRLSSFIFSLAASHGKNPGAVYVKEGDAYLGKIMGGKFFAVSGISEVVKEEIIKTAANPKEAAIAYGKRIGSCSCCGRTLTNQESIDLGIGPICAEKFGW